METSSPTRILRVAIGRVARSHNSTTKLVPPRLVRGISVYSCGDAFDGDPIAKSLIDKRSDVDPTCVCESSGMVLSPVRR